MKLKFGGAAQTVTGSKYLLELRSGKRILIDCGLFQGLKEHRLKNRDPFFVPPSSIDSVILTHAHLDHSGYIPALVRDGFKGAIHCTKSTQDVSEIILQDSGFLQEEEARFANKRGFSKHHPAEPLYTVDDAIRSLESFKSHPFGENIEVADGVTVRFQRAGHILGASSVLIEAEGKKVLFSGDLGRNDDPILNDPEPPPESDAMIIESTYGDRVHSKESVIDRFCEIIKSTIAKNGVVLIPAFAVGRAQLLLYYVFELKRTGRIPDIPVFLNSPMAINMTELLCGNRVDHKLPPDICSQVCGIAKYVRTVEESKELNLKSGPMIIISASGMITGGRILHHIVAFGPKASTTIVLPGYQAEGTRGRTLLRGARTLRMFGEDIEIKATVESLDGLSAHADSDGLVQWVKSAASPPKKIFITHGEPDSADALKKRIEADLKISCVVPQMLEEIEL